MLQSQFFYDILAVPAGTCPTDWTPTYYGTCLKHFNIKKDYNQAKLACNHLGAQLATFRNKLQIIYFKGFLSDVGTCKCSVGECSRQKLINHCCLQWRSSDFILA